MLIHEYQAKLLFKDEGMPLPNGRVAYKPTEAVEIFRKHANRIVIKAQIHAGGRGKAGGVKLASNEDEALEFTNQILGMNIKGLTVEKVLVEEALAIKKEIYLGFVLDRDRNCHCLIFSMLGGVDIEEVAENQPDKIHKAYVNPLFGLLDFQIREILYSSGFFKEYPSKKIQGQIINVIKNLYKAYIKYDALLAEINPLVITEEDDVVVADAKMNIDDNSLFRQPRLLEFAEISTEDEIEREAQRRGVAYVRLNGDVGIIGNGAGLVMTTLDMVAGAGGRPANFLDIGGGAKASSIINALDIILMDKEIKGVLFNIFGGITRCDEVAKGILQALKEMDLKIPIVIRLSGTSEAEGKALLKSAGVHTVSSMKEASEAIVELIKKEQK